MFDVGEYGSNNDSAVLANSNVGERFKRGIFNLPESKHLHECKFSLLPCYLLGDEVVSLKSWLLRPYPRKNMTKEQHVCIFRNSRARRFIENTFAILTSCWCILLISIKASVENTGKCALACLALRNYPRKTNNALYTPAGFFDSENSGEP